MSTETRLGPKLKTIDEILMGRTYFTRANVNNPGNVNRSAPALSNCPQGVATENAQSVVRNHSIGNNFPGSRPENHRQQQNAGGQIVASSCHPAFWTLCSFCGFRHRFHGEQSNKETICRKCGMKFTASEVPPRSAPLAKNSGRTTFSSAQRKNMTSQKACNMEQKQGEKSATCFSEKKSFPVSGCTVNVGAADIDAKRKRKELEESSESGSIVNEDIGIAVVADIKAAQAFGSLGVQQPWRSVCSKRQASHIVVLSDDDEPVNNNGTRSMESHDDDHAKVILPSGINGSEKTTGKEKDQAGAYEGHNSSLEGAAELKVSKCAGPDFNDFDMLRNESNFVVDQIWALYDTVDGMPRSYAQIRKVSEPGFRLRITWLEPDPSDENERSWFEEELPVSVGKFRLGKNQNTNDRLMFSHVICCNEGTSTGHFGIFPRKGETWALFKNWDISWSSDPDSHRSYEYEFVEILSEYGEGARVDVAYLYKAKGFSSVFCRMINEGTDTFQIPLHELYRFSHRVPSFKLTGTEGKGVPKGSYELDPAKLPENIEEIVVAPDQSTEPAKSNSEGSLIPEPKFYNFGMDKSEEKFEAGQIWSLYDKDGLPRCYGRIEKIVLIQTIEDKAIFKLHVSHLKVKRLSNSLIQWHYKRMPISCGTFSTDKGRWHVYSDVTAFSNQIRSESSGGNSDQYGIFPKKGDVWAIYRNWNDKIKASELENWEYDVVEVLEDELDYKVSQLERVYGFKSVFKAATEHGSDVIYTIPRSELLRFSHRVPAFRLTDERDGTLRGFFELDAAALPRNLQSSS